MLSAPRYGILFLALLLAVDPSDASDTGTLGGRAGSGGGAVVCRDPVSGRVVSARFYDLYESRHFGAPVTRTERNNPSEEALAALEPLRGEFPALYRSAVRELDEFRWKVHPQIESERRRFARDPEARSLALRTADDLGSNPELPEECEGLPGVKPGYENIALFYSASEGEDRFRLDFNYEIYRKLTTVEQAALRVHEVLYLLYRSYNLDFSSLHVRPLVAALFTESSPERIRALAARAFGPFEPLRQGSPALDRWVRKESWRLSDREAKGSLASFLSARSEERQYWLEKVLPLRSAVRGGDGPKIQRLLGTDARFYSINQNRWLDLDVSIPIRNDLFDSHSSGKKWRFHLSTIPAAFQDAVRAENWLPLVAYAILLSDAAYDSVALLPAQRTFDPSYATDSGFTALHAAVLKGQVRYVRMLLELYGTRLDAVWVTPTSSPEPLRWTPIELSRALGHSTITKLLEEAVPPPL